MVVRQLLESLGCWPRRRQALFARPAISRSFSSAAGDTIMSWESPPVHRHLSTIGIGPVFVCPPPYPLLPQPDVEEGLADDIKHELKLPPPSLSKENGSELLTWEIVGNIKSTPEDFVVREIGWAPTRILDSAEHHANKNVDCKDEENVTSTEKVVWSRKIAGLDSELDMTITHVGGIEFEQCNDNRMTTKHTTSPRAHDVTMLTESKDSTVQLPALSMKSQHETELDYRFCTDPAEGLRRILLTCYTNNNTEATVNQAPETEGEVASAAILKELADLQNVALDEIDSASSTEIGGWTDDDKSVWISIAKLDKDSRTLLHRYIRQAFPLLRTETSSVCPSDERVEDSAAISINAESSPKIKTWVCALIDRTYFSIAPCLANPRQDLHALYKFRNYGPVMAVLSKDGNKMSNKGGSRQQSNDSSVTSPCRINSVSQGVVFLRLRHDLPKNDRRAIHQALSSSRRREFETSTIHDVPSDDDDKDSTLTTAIVVQWSNQALKVSQKKRKRSEAGNETTIDGDQSEKNADDINATFCVLRKYQCEHQVAVSNIVRALKCRVGDVGLGGIKDMKAITYQFCTLRDIHPQRIHRANRTLGNRIQLINMLEVHGSGSLLDRGKLIGNHFEITIRNMMRVKQFHVEGTQTWKEQKVPLRSSHLDAMVKRITQFGFINFFGEQRVGDAGATSHVGVRSFDVGREMLKLDFSEAINLIMKGRSNRVYSPGCEEINARQVWKSSGGNARQTLKAFPTNRNTMVRERDLIKGLLRYGDPLAALRCIPHNVRMFWIHAYQSHVWNRIATERIRRWGLSPVVGDLYINSKITGLKNDMDNVEIQIVNDPSSVDIAQIVLPLPGYNIQYPSNEIGELYKEILSADGVELSKGDIYEGTAKGSYRKLVQQANNLKWTIVSEHEVGEPEVSKDPVVSAAKFTFELDSGCYATMMLREMMLTTMARETKIE